MYFISLDQLSFLIRAEITGKDRSPLHRPNALCVLGAKGHSKEVNSLRDLQGNAQIVFLHFASSSILHSLRDINTNLHSLRFCNLH